MTHVTVRNGLTLAYMVAAINAALGLLVSFGVHVTEGQQAALIAFTNAAVLLAARVLHLPEKVPGGGTIQVTHTPILVERKPATAAPPPTTSPPQPNPPPEATGGG